MQWSVSCSYKHSGTLHTILTKMIKYLIPLSLILICVHQNAGGLGKFAYMFSTVFTLNNDPTALSVVKYYIIEYNSSNQVKTLMSRVEKKRAR